MVLLLDYLDYSTCPPRKVPVDPVFCFYSFKTWHLFQSVPSPCDLLGLLALSLEICPLLYKNSMGLGSKMFRTCL